MTLRICPECNNDMRVSRTTCPHCGRPQFFPNVDIANSSVEVDKLNLRYDAGKEECNGRGQSGLFERFEATCEASAAVFACSLQKLNREVATGTELFDTFFDLERLRLQSSTPGDFDWRKLRPQAEIELLGSHDHLDKIHYACLSLDWASLTNYGDCFVKLSEPMIAHRATCFEGNTAVIYAVDRDFKNYLRCGWSRRGKIACAVFSKKLTAGISESEFASLLVKACPESENDEFIEVHVFGAMSARTFSEVRFDTSKHSRSDSVYRKAVEAKLRSAGVSVSIA